jgi:hypothetical protein
VEADNLYLEPEAAFAEAQRLAGEQGESLPLAPRTLFRRLKERGLLASWDERRQRNTVRRTLEGVKDREILHLRADTLSSSRPSEPSAGRQTDAKTSENADHSCGRSCGRSDDFPEEPSAETVRKNSQKTPGALPCGRFGRSEMGGGGTGEGNCFSDNGTHLNPGGDQEGDGRGDAWEGD